MKLDRPAELTHPYIDSVALVGQPNIDMSECYMVGWGEDISTYSGDRSLSARQVAGEKGAKFGQFSTTLQWRHYERDGVSNHQSYDCLLNRLFRRRSKKTPKLRVTGLCAGSSPVTGEFPAQMASNAENVSILLRHCENTLLYVLSMILHLLFLQSGNMHYGIMIHSVIERLNCIIDQSRDKMAAILRTSFLKAWTW